MRILRLVSVLVASVLCAALIGCSSSTPGTQVKAPISIVFTSNPANSMAEGSTQSISATTNNDSAGGGVKWAVTCSSADCGGFSNSTTASGTATKYKAPATIPSGGSIRVTATAADDTTKSVSATITVTQATTLGDGTYVFSLAGQDQSSFFLYYVAGAFTVSGGAITGGEQDLIDYFLGTLSDPITSGTITVTPDGNVQIVLTTADTQIGVNGVETLNASMVSGSRALINEFDASATSSGALDLQTSTHLGQGGYAFIVQGSDSSTAPAAIGGVVNVDGSGTISGTGSVFDLNDQGAILASQPIDPSTATAPDAFGRFTLSLDLATSGVGGVGLIGYVVDGKQIHLIENNNDALDCPGDFCGTVGGNAFAQSGAFSAASLANSSYVFGLNGADVNGPFQIAGVLSTTDGVNMTGTLNYNDLSNGGTQAPIAVTGTAAVDSTGRVTLTNLTDAGNSFSFNAELYLDGNGHATMLTLDSTDEVAGLARQQTGGGSFTAGSFSGTYAFDLTGYDFTSEFEIDAVGAIQSHGASVLTGSVDLNVQNTDTQTAGLTVNGTYTASADGVFGDGLTGLDVTTPANADTFTYYLIDNTSALAIETDTNQLGLGIFELQH